MKHQKGLSLVELMVALVLGLLVVAAVIELFMSSRQLYRTQDVKARMQEDGRYAIHHIGELLSRAGYWGCNSRGMQDSSDYDDQVTDNDGSDQGSASLINVLTSANNYFWNMDAPIQGHEATGGAWSPALPAAIGNNGAIPGSDVLTFRTTGSSFFHVLSHDADDYTQPLVIADNNGLDDCDPDTDNNCSTILMVSTCDKAAIFQVTNNDASGGTLEHATGVGTPGNSTADLGDNYGGGWINTVSSHSFYIRNNPEGIPSLYHKILDNNADALLEGVEQMQLRYGVDNDGDFSVDNYLTADAVEAAGAWTDVISVRISLVMVNIDIANTADATATNLALGDGSYTLDGAVITPDDGRLRRVFTQTIMLKNRSS